MLITLFFIGRVFLFSIYFDNFITTDANIWLSFLYGLKMDTIVASMLLIIPTISLTLLPSFLAKHIDAFLKYYFLVVISILIYIEIATFPFMAQYDCRPNYLFVEYLEYPKEVFDMILADYKLPLLLAFITIAAFVRIYLKTHKNDFLEVTQQPYIKRVIWFLPIGLLIFIGIRSSFGHRPANISDAMYSSNRVLNEVTKNSIYSIGYAIYSAKKHSNKDIAKRYGKIDLNEAISRVQKRLEITDADKKYILSRFEKSNFESSNTKNIVILIEESMGYQFVKAVGGEDGITPNLNKLASEGITFTNLYSNGTRSVRGLAGLSAGNFSIPGKGVIKRNKSQSDYFTIAKLLKPLGYHTSFIYGGESRFDNMKGWYLGNSFDEVIDKEKFENPSFVGTWGVCDEEVVLRANEEFKKLHRNGKKFASVIFSTTNHTPFDFPDGKFELIDGVEKKSVKNAIKYADFAIGRFIEEAKKEAYYKDTVFVIAADHNVRVYGNDIFPVEMFQIPGVILGGDIDAKVYNGISTQPDVLATALDLAGISATTPIMGHSIFSDKKQNLSLMQFNDSYALRVDDKVAVIRPRMKPLTLKYENKHLNEIEHDDELEKDLLSFITVLNHIYQNRLYR
ncbi:MAG: sulfatase-like hydrolase/transferase [Campylobacterales bacterium]|nr:sulfatase-like hydrolase/transferase [Campylobacterales bacterium]